MKKDIILYMIAILSILFMVMFAIFTITYEKQIEEFCEAQGGEHRKYREPDCYFKEDGVYQSYDIRKINGKWRLVK